MSAPVDLVGAEPGEHVAVRVAQLGDVGDAVVGGTRDHVGHDGLDLHAVLDLADVLGIRVLALALLVRDLPLKVARVHHRQEGEDAVAALLHHVALSHRVHVVLELGRILGLVNLRAQVLARPGKRVLGLLDFLLGRVDPERLAGALVARLRPVVVAVVERRRRCGPVGT